MGVGGSPGPVRQYVSGLGVTTLGLCAAGWLALAPAEAGYRGPRAGTAQVQAAQVQAAQVQAAQVQAALHRAALADWGTAAALGAVSLATLVAWIVAWRRRLRADGILAPSARRQAWRDARAQRRQERRREQDEARTAEVAEPVAGPPDPARVLNELRALLIPLLDEPAQPELAQPDSAQPESAQAESAQAEPAQAESARPASAAVPMPRPGGLAAMESMLAGAELLMVACGEEEAW